MVYPANDIDRMTVGERLALIDQVWESLRHDAGVLPLNDTERAVIEARRAEHRADPSAAVPWETVRADLLSDQEADEDQTRSTKPRLGMPRVSFRPQARAEIREARRWYESKIPGLGRAFIFIAQRPGAAESASLDKKDKTDKIQSYPSYFWSAYGTPH